MLHSFFYYIVIQGEDSTLNALEMFATDRSKAAVWCYFILYCFVVLLLGVSSMFSRRCLVLVLVKR